MNKNNKIKKKRCGIACYRKKTYIGIVSSAISLGKNVLPSTKSMPNFIRVGIIINKICTIIERSLHIGNLKTSRSNLLYEVFHL